MSFTKERQFKHMGLVGVILSDLTCAKYSMESNLPMYLMVQQSDGVDLLPCYMSTDLIKSC